MNLNKQRDRGRPPSENPMERTAVALPRDLLDRLRADAERADRGISTEIRQRLQLTYDLESLPRDQETSHFVGCIEALAANLASDMRQKWHDEVATLAAFKAGVDWFLDQYKPKQVASVGSAQRSTVLSETADPPEAVGRTHARLIWAAQRGGSGK
jgi:hypothetical protein